MIARFGDNYYCNKKRWLTYYRQIEFTQQVCDKNSSILVVGPGDYIVPDIFKYNLKYKTDTYDIDKGGTYVGDVRHFASLVHDKYDVILCCEVLEHFPFEEFGAIVTNLVDRTKKRLILSMPVFLGEKKVSPQHKWELGWRVEISEITEFLKHFGEVTIKLQDRFIFFVVDINPYFKKYLKISLKTLFFH